MIDEAGLSMDQKRESLLEKALFILQDAIVVLDRHAIIIYINKAAQQIFFRRTGRTAAPGDDYYLLAPAERMAFTQSCIEQAFGNRPTVFELNESEEGKNYWIEVGYHPIPDDNGSITYVCVRAKDITEKVELQLELEKQRQSQKNKMVKATLDAQERERMEIGRELHDNVNQVLTTIKLYNEICLTEERTNKRLLLKSIQQVNYCIETIRDLSKTLTGPNIGEMDLVDALRELVTSITTTRRIAGHFYTYGLKGEKISQDLQTNIFRIAQEQLTNVLKYAQASKVDVMLVGTATSVALSIQDDGMGFDLERKRKGVGITNMMNRAETLEGRIEFTTSPGNGCTMMVEFPI